ncbi:hypothetical protein ANSO36C_32200 [Nostoc cf. commune SO-36]|uniref:Uncharacterized protein n=1 Tax=Nostoc cf. commune SO-36 TaxID=449208 RepID=A0ABN6Q7L6_NOSCO|nr:hypothetical protein ANSO36C_32200 [Nostoc cf. commune SO-36]
MESATGVCVLAAIATLLCFILTLVIKEQKVIRSTEPISFKALAAGAKFVWQNQLILAAIIKLRIIWRKFENWY